MKRVLHVVGKLDRGGIETWLLQVLEHSDRQACEMDFLVHCDEPGVLDEQARALGAKILPCVGPSSPLRYALKFRRILKEHGPYDVVHSHVHWFSGFVLTLAALCGVRVRIAHGHTGQPETRSGLRKRAYVYVMRRLLRRFATHLWAVSEVAGRSLLRNWISSEHCEIRPLGIDLRRFKGTERMASSRTEFGIADDALIAVHVGRFDQVKNHKFLVMIANELANLDGRCRLLLVGDGKLRPEIEQQVQERGLKKHVVFAGHRNDVPELLLRVVDGFVLPSKYEGFPVALMEAQLAGLRCVVSDSITPESEIFPGSVNWLSLNDPAPVWADAVYRSMRGARACIPDQVKSRYSISGDVERLMFLYGCSS